MGETKDRVAALEAAVQELQADRNALKAQVRELEDVREIKALFDRWHHECTGGFGGLQAGRMEALEVLSEDATIEVKELHEPGKGPKGREAYTRFWSYFYGDAGPLPYVFQTSLGDRVEVNGDEAIHYSNMLGIFQMRDGAPRLSLSQRRNWLRRTPQGWQITKTTSEGGMGTELSNLRGHLNQLPPAEPRKPWTYGG